MTPEQFIYWLQGFMEIADPKELNEKQTQILKDHITLVLKKETPNGEAPTISITSTFPTAPTNPPLFGPASDNCFICGKKHDGLQCPRIRGIC